MEALSPRLREFERTLTLTERQRREFHDLVLDAIKLESAYDRAIYKLEKIEVTPVDPLLSRPVTVDAVKYRRIG